MSYDIDTYVKMFPNLEKNIIEVVCEQNLDPTCTFESLLDISNNTFIKEPENNSIKLDNKISKEDEKNIYKASTSIGLSSLLNSIVGNNQNIQYTKLENIDENTDENIN